MTNEEFQNIQNICKNFNFNKQIYKNKYPKTYNKILPLSEEVKQIVKNK